ncbi:HAD family hydrolase [Actinomadura hibisca]|uniref:HAD family hydrolase n=1 Tax=Actinomadura hibisca TaxID=68565 RepID=UPI000837A73B|nr:HAD family phosphatase [Actinomadura hibisca]
MAVRAVVFDLDGVLIDSEPVWEEVRRGFVADHGGHWQADSQERLMGMSTEEWSAYLAEDLIGGMDPEDVAYQVIDRMSARYAEHLPLLPGAVGAVRRLASDRTLGLASSSPRALIDLVLGEMGVAGLFRATVSTEEADRGKPAPDGYLLAAARLGTPPEQCVAIEDSSNGLRAAHNAGMRVIAVPHPRYPPAEDALALAAYVADDLADLTPEKIDSL